MKSQIADKSTTFLTVSIMTILFTASIAWSEPLMIDDFKNGISPGWESKEFKGITKYEPVTIDTIPCLRASAEGTASGLFYKIKYDPQQQPILTWKWKIDNIVKDGNAHTKNGDDYAARIYVVFPSILFWKTKALNYVWANRLPKGKAVPNSYTSNTIMVAVESGPANTGKWIEYRRNIYEDFKKYFGSTPAKVGAIAIMTDTDTTGNKVTACYGPIYIDSKIDSETDWSSREFRAVDFLKSK